MVAHQPVEPARSMTSASIGVSAVTVAVRGPPSMSEISPRKPINAELINADHTRTSGLYLIRCGWSAAVPSSLWRNAS